MYRKTTSAETSDNVDGTEPIKYGRVFLINRTLHIIKAHSPGRKHKKTPIVEKDQVRFSKKNSIKKKKTSIFSNIQTTNSELIKSKLRFSVNTDFSLKLP